MNKQNQNDNILDSLLSDDAAVVDDGISAEMHLPAKCKKCMNAAICKILPALLGFSTYGIKISIDECPFENGVS